MALKKIINIHASWCGPCAAFEKTFNNVSCKEEFNNIIFERYDLETPEGDDYAQKFNVKSIPSTILLDENDNQIVKVTGNISEAEFIEIINGVATSKK